MSEYNYDNAPTNPHHGGKMTPTDMSRRIEELEEAERVNILLIARIEEQVEWVKSLADDLIAAAGREVCLKENLAKAVEGFEKLACLGSGDRHGNSDGNVIAQRYIAELEGEAE